MISNKDLHEELNAIGEVIKALESPYEKTMLKATELQIKLLYNLRTNMVTVMKHLNVPMKSNEARKEEE